jgi:hypothetical protein
MKLIKMSSLRLEENCFKNVKFFDWCIFIWDVSPGCREKRSPCCTCSCDSWKWGPPLTLALSWNQFQNLFKFFDLKGLLINVGVILFYLKTVIDKSWIKMKTWQTISGGTHPGSVPSGRPEPNETAGTDQFLSENCCRRSEK